MYLILFSSLTSNQLDRYVQSIQTQNDLLKYHTHILQTEITKMEKLRSTLQAFAEELPRNSASGYPPVNESVEFGNITGICEMFE